jgi:hypothetical protein
MAITGSCYQREMVPVSDTELRIQRMKRTTGQIRGVRMTGWIRENYRKVYGGTILTER